ncbi:MAG: class I SAM-dependent methyltransferase [Deltaproteobacteria bacterium]
MAERTWEDEYQSGFMPWDTGAVDPALVRWVERGRVGPGKALEIGCGTGTNVLYLAERGFEVLGVDVAPTAIERTRVLLEGRTNARAEVRDILSAPLEETDFDFVFDRGCFHIFDGAEQQALFAERVAEALAVGGVWVSLLGSTEGAPRDHGPPRRSARDIALAVEPALEIVELVGTDFEDHAARAWMLVARKRAESAQPSTR